jgi:hypothetical protein
MMIDSAGHRVDTWLAALDARYLSDLTPSEVARALRALSSCYVERRGRLGQGSALGSAGKRAAFALYYAPLHFLLVRHILRALPVHHARITAIQDLGCGTGSAGAAWALETPGARVSGFDRHPWAVAEANWTYRQLGIEGRAVQLDIARVQLPPAKGTAVIAAYAMNEVPDAVRSVLLRRLLDAGSSGTSVLVIEPIARRVAPWWRSWEASFEAAGGRADEWRFPAALPARQRDLAKAAGLDPRELTARSLMVSSVRATPRTQ